MEIKIKKTIKELPEDERPREKLLKYGAGQLPKNPEKIIPANMSIKKTRREVLFWTNAAAEFYTTI